MILVRTSAINPNFSFRSGENSNSSKLCDSTNESIVESRGARREFVDRGLRSRVGKQHLIRGEKPFTLLKVLEVGIVENPRRCGVHVNGDCGVHI